MTTTEAETNVAIRELSFNTIRTLAMDAVQKANSGHPGTAMSLAPVAYALYRDVMSLDPSDPHWANRDRFVLSCGHACMLQYATLHLAGYDVTLEQIEHFRQFGWPLAGHPEYGHVPGIEISTGPLGQGISNAVGMAIGERMRAARYNRPEHEIFDHHTYTIVSDGDMEEGISGEASSIAGHLGLGKLTAIYDKNHISIEGDTALAFTEDVAKRYEAYNWHVQSLDDGFTYEALLAALAAARAVTDRPSMIVIRTHIAWGAPHAEGTAGAHGSPLGEEEIRLTKRVYGWPEDAHFLVPDEVAEHMSRVDDGAELHAAWSVRYDAWKTAHPELAGEFERTLEGRLPDGLEAAIPTFDADAKGIATRAAGGKVLNAIAATMPELVGGSADLAPSTSTLFKDGGSISKDDFSSRNFHFGIREHAMGAIVNGLTVYGGFRVFGSTFLTFSDYMRGAVRLAALMELPATWVWTHDSVWLGEDGPTHQPVEHLAALRAIPHLHVIRPADANETSFAWRAALERTDGPTALILTRQGLPTVDRSSHGAAEGVLRGGYVLADADGTPDAIVIATGSEVTDALTARATLKEAGIDVRVVSLPCWERFREQDDAYRESVLPAAVTARVSLEAAVTFGWLEWVGPAGRSIGIDHFGASGPGETVARAFGISPDSVVDAVKELVNA